MNFLFICKENPTKKQELDKVIEEAMNQFPANSPLYTISQGPATMPLTGVDVPFHSDMLLGTPEIPPTYLFHSQAKSLVSENIFSKLLTTKHLT